MYTMKFYDLDGNNASEVNGLTRDEVTAIYRGIMSAVGRARKTLNRDPSPAFCFNLNFPTVWDEETGERVAGY